MYIFCTDCNQTKLYTHKAMIQTVSRAQAAALITLKEQRVSLFCIKILHLRQKCIVLKQNLSTVNFVMVILFFIHSTT